MNRETAENLFRGAVERIEPLPEELIHQFLQICHLVPLEKDEIFIHGGEVPHYAAFNCQGIFRLYYIDKDGNDLTKGFSGPGNMVISYSAMVQNRPSYFFIQALGPAWILKFNFTKWQEMIDRDIRWYPFIFALVRNIYMEKEHREKAFLLDDAATRYRDFRTRFPRLVNELKLYHIASYLGITPEALSRIRKKGEN